MTMKTPMKQYSSLETELEKLQWKIEKKHPQGSQIEKERQLKVKSSNHNLHSANDDHLRMKYKKVLEMDSKEDEQKESRNIAESEK